MRSGLLAVGVILLVLGAIFYFVPTPATATQEDSVTTTTYATNDAWGNNTTNNSTNMTDTWSDRQTVSDSWTTTSVTSDTERVNTADTDDEGVPVAYVYLDDNGDMFSENGKFLGSGLGTSDMTTTVGERYGTSTVSDTGAQSGSYDTTTAQAGTTDTATGGAGDVYADRQTVAETENVDTQAVYADGNDSNASSTLFGDDRENLAAGGAAGGANWIRTLSVLAMVLGAILAILGLVLPSRDYDRADHRARTAGPAGRRVRYERDEEVVTHRRR